MKNAANKEAKSKRQQEEERAFVEMMAATSLQDNAGQVGIPQLTDEYTGSLPPWGNSNPTEGSRLMSPNPVDALDETLLPVLEDEVQFPLTSSSHQLSTSDTTISDQSDIPVLNDVFLEASATQDMNTEDPLRNEAGRKRKARIDSSSIDEMVLAMLPKIKLEVRKAVLHEMVEIEKTLVKKIEQQLIKAILKEFNETGRYQ